MARVLKSPPNPQNCRKEAKILEKGAFIFCAKLWYAPNPGSKANADESRWLTFRQRIFGVLQIDQSRMSGRRTSGTSSLRASLGAQVLLAAFAFVSLGNSQFPKMSGKAPGSPRHPLAVLSHHLKCEMKSPHLVDFSWDFVDFQSNLSRILADF